MFGKPAWFRPKRIGWGLTPITWQGWVYTLLWTALIVIPFVGLVERHQGIEAIVWLTVSVLALVRDARQIRSQMADAEGEVDAGISDDERLANREPQGQAQQQTQGPSGTCQMIQWLS